MKPFNKLLDYFQDFRVLAINRMISPAVMEEDSLAFWRVNILFAILFSGSVFCVFAIIAAASLVIKEKAWSFAIFDILAYVICISLLFSRRLSYETRTALTLLMVYAAGLAVIISFGPLSGGPLWLFTFAVLSGVLLGSRAAILAIALNGITLMIIAILLNAGKFGQTFPFFNTWQLMVSTLVNFIILNLIATISVSVLLKGLISSNRKEKDLSDSLQQEQVRLIDAKEKLEDEVEDRKQAEKALLESETKYRLLADNISDNIWILNLGTLSFSYVSPSVVGITGYTAEEATGFQLHDILTPASMELATKRLSEELLLEGQNGDPLRSLTLELEQYHKYKSTVWTEISMRFIRDTEGRPSAILGVTRDISKRKQTEGALRESESNLQSVFEAVPVGICFMKDRVYQRANRNWCDSFGYHEESLLGKTPEFLYENKKEYERVGKELYGHMLEDGIASVYTKLKRSDGEFRDVVLIAKPLDAQNMEAGTVVVIHDITDRKHAEEARGRLEDQLHQAQKMEAIGTLAGGIAHDFNNLLMAIQGRASIMLMDKDPSHPDFEYLRGIESYVGSAADLTRQLLGFARGGKYEVKPTDLNKLIKKESRMFGRTKKEINILEKYAENLWSVEIDRGQIQQVLLNLHVNAWQAMPGGGDLYLETENVILDDNYVKPFSVKPGQYVKISITDTGIGMDKATQERIFDPFFTTKEMARGTGLGLASAYGIIKNHGGFINVYSEKDHGSTFNLYLPASRKEVIEAKKHAGETLRGVGTVLFVDDEGIIIETAKDLLEFLGYNVLTAGSGKEAIKIYEENKEQISVVILDMVMPNMSGSDTYDRMKDINPNVKVLLSSGYSIGERAEKILDRGCNGFIQKPFKVEELSLKLRGILDKKG